MQHEDVGIESGDLYRPTLWYERRLAKLIAFFEATSQAGKRLEDSSASPIVQSRIKPRRVALATASVRLTTSSLRKMVFTCAFTVPSPMNSSALISLLASDAIGELRRKD